MLEKTSLARKVRGFDLCSVEAKHHASCHWVSKMNTTTSFAHRWEWKPAHTEQTHITAAHNEACDSALQLVLDLIIQQKKVIKLSSLRLIYIDKLDECGYPNDGYRSENLMSAKSSKYKFPNCLQQGLAWWQRLPVIISGARRAHNCCWCSCMCLQFGECG